MANSVRYDRGIFAANLRRLMEQHGERQVDIAKLLSVSKSTVSAYLSGEQTPRMDKIEALSRHYGVPISAIIEPAPAEQSVSDGGVIPLRAAPIVRIYDSLNEQGQGELVRYGNYLSGREEYRAKEPAPVEYIKHYLVPAAAGYASPIEGDDYELIPRSASVPAGADFCISIQGDSMSPYIPDGSLVYVRRDSPLREFDVGVFFVDGDVFCKQWCVDYAGTLHLLSANPRRQDANISIDRSSGRSCVCFGKVLLDKRLPRPAYL